MRLNDKIRSFIKASLLEIEPGSKILLFGSRVDDQAKGGDIDILWLTGEKVPVPRIRAFKVNFYKLFGWQKIDIVNFTFADHDPFKDLAITTGTEL